MPAPFNTTSPSPSRALFGVTLVNGRTFTVAGPDGSLEAAGDGTIFEDVRMLSTFQFMIADQDGDIPRELLGTSSPTPFHSLAVSRPDPGRMKIAGEPTELYVHRQWVGHGSRHDIEIRNTGAEPITRKLTLHVATDFANLFDVKANQPSGVSASMVIEEGGSIALCPLGRADELLVRVASDPVPENLDCHECLLEWDLTCEPRSVVSVAITFTPIWDGHEPSFLFPLGTIPSSGFPARTTPPSNDHAPHVTSTDPRLTHAFSRTLEDLASLRIFDPSNPSNVVIAAGAPWFMTLFGRDSLLTSWMALPFAPELAKGVLTALGELQGSASMPETEEEPGKIIHELRRHGSSEAFSHRGRYFGTIDATPLYVMLAAETARWGHLDDHELAAIWPNIVGAVHWTLRALDRGPGEFIAYERSTAIGLANQGWKDSWDGINFADGHIVDRGPIALVEVQGYAYAALVGAAMLAERRDDGVLDPTMLLARAERLRERFNEAFWLEKISSFSVGLSGEQQHIDSVTTNPGHAVWTGIADVDLANRYLDRCLDGDLWSGWGLRTLSPSSAAYNPLSYHNGSVWPHDTSIVAAGAALVGRHDVVRAVVDGALDATQHFEGRPPELFAGIGRSDVPTPVSYPSSCSPQAWSSASIMLNLRSLLGLGPPPSGSVLPVVKETPDRSMPFSVTGIRVGATRVQVSSVGEHPLLQKQA